VTVTVQASTMVSAPRETVAAVYADYPSWPRMFRTINSVRLLRHDGSKLVLQIDHAEGRVINELDVRAPDEIDLYEVKRHYDGRFVNRFEAVAGGTRFTVTGQIQLKGWARLLRPLLPPYARRLIRRLQMEPVKNEAERRARTIGSIRTNP
jgi:Polyketide cyclase / dehydrase and lipid transport